MSVELIRGCAYCGKKKKIKNLYLKSPTHRYFCDEICEQKFIKEKERKHTY